ncbi:MAG: hypothetical protein BJ554DRAFT_4209 [Olpidium bornovanus]|uniref:Uncharacterized protein n=1 Tax=Olpidium bornovanus TaxID=278681 RepID=A0A8H8A0E5_9FUNG|nr:MAG: hypothetical protein BJ554DRAFT_4209 [Olpidium bornovanus]
MYSRRPTSTTASRRTASWTPHPARWRTTSATSGSFAARARATGTVKPSPLAAASSPSSSRPAVAATATPLPPCSWLTHYLLQCLAALGFSKDFDTPQPPQE